MNPKNYLEYDNIGDGLAARLPSHWTSTRVKNVSICLDYLRIPKNNSERAEIAGDIPYWGANSIQGYVNKALVDGPVVLIGEDGAPFFDLTKPVAFAVNGPLWPNNHVHVLRSKPSIDHRFLAACLNSVDYSLHVKGSTRDKLNQSDLMSIEIPYPPVLEQRAIADFIDWETAEIDAFISDQLDLIELLNERRRSALQSVAASIGSVLTVRLRYLYRQSREANRSELDVLSVYRDYGVIPKSSRTDNFNKTPEDVTRYLVVQPGYLVINKMKAWQGSLGVSAHEGIVSPDYEVLIPTSRALLPEYVHHILRSPEYVASYAVRSVGIRPSQWRLYWDQMKDIAIPVPDMATQQRFVEGLSRDTAEIDAAIADAREAIALSKERRAAVISAAVTGKIDVRNWKAIRQTENKKGESVGVA